MIRTLGLSFHHAPLALLIATSTLAAACGGAAPTSPSSGGPDTTTPTPIPTPSQSASPAGIYQFVAINGTPVPGVFETWEPGLGIKMATEAVRGQLMLNPDGSYYQEMEMRLHSNVGNERVLSKAAAGSYTMPGGTLTMTPSESGVPFQPHYTPGQIKIQTEAPGLDGTPQMYTFTFRR
jgi:hypothetical protein